MFEFLTNIRETIVNTNCIHMIFFLTMFFFHIHCDFLWQGVLANLKNKSWWEKLINVYPETKYDYIMALILHGYQWSFSIHIPWLIYSVLTNNLSGILVLSIAVNGVCHSYVDHQKANEKTINLIIDQCIHIIQILASNLILLKLINPSL